MKIEGENRLWEANLICLEAGHEHDAPQQCFMKAQDLSLQAKVGFSFILQLPPSFQRLSFLPSTARGWVANKAQHLAHPFPYISKEFSPCMVQDWAFIPSAGTGGFWLLEILEMKGMGKAFAFFFSCPAPPHLPGMIELQFWDSASLIKIPILQAMWWRAYLRFTLQK